ncbi:helix-turn-helix domain-containing protein [Yinghuangia sp. ASG 101]|uniref:helix-turn-helix domain-containing protein n=1 Tax=Yinghuangia sp. ASG 101 TaxID=2896848 RepID=UPI001E4453E4|nr:helix-turn-helix transcriptional regulator [Yinghuangia sp. ASG 101]UGQ14982.1 helix-turn-helix domain-containing protein [Yinghuangia sp. ASG 101]
MSQSPSSSAQQAREALAARLRQIMVEAGLNASRVAEQAGWYPSKSSRLLTAKTAPSRTDIEAWCRVCGVPQLARDLIAQAAEVQSMYALWRTQVRSGMLRLQTEPKRLHARTTSFKCYASDVLPGFVQTFAYARALITAYGRFHGAPDDADASAAARVERSRIIHRRGRTFALVIEEAALYHRVGDVDVMREQLRHLIDVARLPAVSVGIIPTTNVEREYPMDTTFGMFDDSLVRIELLTAQVRVTAPSEVRDYVRAFDIFSRAAVHGSEARRLIVRALAGLGDPRDAPNS